MNNTNITGKRKLLLKPFPPYYIEKQTFIEIIPAILYFRDRSGYQYVPNARNLNIELDKPCDDTETLNSVA